MKKNGEEKAQKIDGNNGSMIDLSHLEGIIKWIVIDGKINKNEIVELDSCCFLNSNSYIQTYRIQY